VDDGGNMCTYGHLLWIGQDASEWQDGKARSMGIWIVGERDVKSFYTAFKFNINRIGLDDSDVIRFVKH
jgi:hypothetical protein